MNYTEKYLFSGLDRNGEQAAPTALQQYLHLRCYYKPLAPPEQMTKTKAPAGRPVCNPGGTTCL